MWAGVMSPRSAYNLTLWIGFPGTVSLIVWLSKAIHPWWAVSVLLFVPIFARVLQEIRCTRCSEPVGFVFKEMMGCKIAYRIRLTCPKSCPQCGASLYARNDRRRMLCARASLSKRRPMIDVASVFWGVAFASTVIAVELCAPKWALPLMRVSEAVCVAGIVILLKMKIWRG